MNENNETLTDFLGEEDEPLLPDGWKEGDDLFAEADGDAKLFEPDGAEAEESEAVEDQEAEPEGADPTTDGETQEPSQSSEEQTAEPEPDGAEPKTEKAPRILKLRVNHAEEDLDIDAMSDDDLTALLQKGRAFDALKETENKRRFRQVYQEQLEAGMSEALAKLVAQNETGGKAYPLEDKEEPEPVSTPAPAKEEKPASTRDFKAEVEQLKALYPDFKEVPDEVARAAAGGVPLLSAYLAYRDKQGEKTAAKLRKENEVLKQNAASAAKAPVRGVTGGGVTHKKTDPFIKGFDSEW